MENRKLSELWGIVLHTIRPESFICNEIKALSRADKITWEERTLLLDEMDLIRPIFEAWFDIGIEGMNQRIDFINQRIAHHLHLETHPQNEG